MLEAILTHLLQSTVFAAVAGLLTLTLRKSPSRARYWVWLAASLKFLVPFSLLMGVGSRLAWRTPAISGASRWIVVEEIRRAGLHSATLSVGPTLPDLGATLFALWLIGFAAILSMWAVKSLRLRAVVRAAVPLRAGREVEAFERVARGTGWRTAVALRSCAGCMEPGVFGLFRPVLLFPSGIVDRLGDAHLEAIAAHELAHIRNRDNLLAACHMAVEAIFWFHPLVWWLRARLVEERERACDEDVLRSGSEPETYAESILKVCRFYVESPLVCAAGVTGADLKKRIECIMTRDGGVSPLTFWRKLLLAGATLAAIAGPIAVGAAAFDNTATLPGAASRRASIVIRPEGGLTATNATLKSLIEFAYNLKEYQISGGPAWIDSERFNISATSPGNQPAGGVRGLLRKVLADRFKLKLRHDVKQLRLFAMTAGQHGPNFHEFSRQGPKQERKIRIGPGRLTAQGIGMSDLAQVLSGQLGSSIVDRTGLRGVFEIQLTWGPDQPLLNAVQKQLGLRLEPGTGPVEVVSIEHAESR